MIKTTIYAKISRESAYEKGKLIGLTGEALRMFSYFNEVKLVIKIDDYGVVSKISTIQDEIAVKIADADHECIGEPPF